MAGMLRKTLVPLVALLLLIPNVSFGAVTGAERAALIRQVEVLTREVVRLQELLAEKLGSAGYRANTTDTRYSVVGGRLLRGSGASVDPTHQDLFELLNDVIGSSAVDEYIQEFRVGYVHDASLDDYIEGFVSYQGEDAGWVMKLKRDGTKPLSAEERELFEELFVHEYAHILGFYETEFSSAFAEQFWGTDTYKLSERTERVFERDGYGALDGEYRGHGASFVSGYAMLSPDEDIAETFVAFVERSYPNGLSLVDRKLRFFYTNPTMVRERESIRENLGL